MGKTAVPVHFAIGESNRGWPGIPTERALEWTRVFLRRYPSVPGTIIWRVRPDLAEGRPAGFTDWAARAREAESVGFTPARYEALHAALDALPADEFAAHPDNHLERRGLKAVRPFDAALWARWIRLVDAGADERLAAAELLR